LSPIFEQLLEINHKTDDTLDVDFFFDFFHSLRPFASFYLF